MKLNRMVVPALSLFLGATGLCIAGASGVAQGPGSGIHGQDHDGWDTPPREMRDMQRQGFRDGIEGARKDIGNHRQPNVNNREEFRSPNVPRSQRKEYREGFRRGYDLGISRMMGGHDQPMRDSGAGVQIAVPGMGISMGVGTGQGNDIQHRGFEDGMEGARKDMGNHRHPNVNNRDEYRHPNVPRGMRNEYRDAFRRGYEQAMSHRMMDGQMGGPDRH